MYKKLFLLFFTATIISCSDLPVTQDEVDYLYKTLDYFHEMHNTHSGTHAEYKGYAQDVIDEYNKIFDPKRNRSILSQKEQAELHKVVGNVVRIRECKLQKK